MFFPHTYCSTIPLNHKYQWWLQQEGPVCEALCWVEGKECPGIFDVQHGSTRPHLSTHIPGQGPLGQPSGGQLMLQYSGSSWL